MSSQITNTLIPNDRAFSVNFSITDYDKSINSHPILDIWNEIKFNIKQEEKNNAYIYLYHPIKRTDSLESISQLYYNTTNYWWLALVANDAIEPFGFLDDALYDSASIKVIKNEFLPKVLSANTSLDLSSYLGSTNGR